MFREAFYQSTLPQVIVDEHLHYHVVNQAFCDFLGYSKDEYTVHTIERVTHPDDFQADLQLFKQLVQGDISEYHIVKRYFHKDGQERLGRLKVSKIRDQASNNNYYLGQVFDLTEVRRSEKLAVIGQIAAGMAHEIRNPLTPLKGFTQLLQKGMPLDQTCINLMLNEINRIDQMIGHFIELSKPPMEENKAPICIDHLLTTVIEGYRPQASGMRKKISYLKKWQNPLVVHGNASALMQVFTHLLQNAMEATEENGHIEVALDHSSTGVKAAVKDNGHGISLHRLERIGEPFYSTKEKGIGLGLTTSYRIIENHDGSIQIKSKEGKGTIVTVSLPFPSQKTNEPSA